MRMKETARKHPMICGEKRQRRRKRRKKKKRRRKSITNEMEIT